MTTDNQTKADKLRAAAGILRDIDFEQDAQYLESKARIIAPPEPAYEDGLYCWVYDDGMSIHMHREGGNWLDAYGHPTSAFDPPENITRVRVLDDDEIAVKRIWRTCSAASWRGEARNAQSQDYPTHAAATLCRAYADALDAEAGDRS